MPSWVRLLTQQNLIHMNNIFLTLRRYAACHRVNTEYYHTLSTEALQGILKKQKRQLLLSSLIWAAGILIVAASGAEAKVMGVFITSAGGGFVVTQQDFQRRKKAIEEVLRSRRGVRGNYLAGG